MKKLGCFIIILLLFGVPAFASIFKDSGNNVYFIKGNSLKISQDNCKTWAYASSIPTSDAYFGEDPAGSKYFIFHKDNMLLLAKSSNNQFANNIRQIYTFGITPEGLSINLSNNLINIYYLNSGNLFSAFSSNSGISFSPPQTLNNNIKVDLFAANQENSQIVFTSGNNIYTLSNKNGWGLPQEICRSKNKIESISIANTPYWIEKTINNEYLLINYLDSSAKIIYNSADSIEDLRIENSNLLSFSLFKDNLYAPHYLISNNGKYSLPKPIKERIELGDFFEGIISLSGMSASLWSNGNDLSLSKLGEDIPPPQLLISRAKTNNNFIKFSIKSTSGDSSLSKYKVDISQDNSFSKLQTFDNLSSEAIIWLPDQDGKYFIKGYENNIISTSPPSDINFIVLDRNPPLITIQNPENNSMVNTQNVEVKGSISEEASLTINSLPIILNNLTFSKSVSLNPGVNIITLVATDEAGNSTSEALSLTYNKGAPSLTVISPNKINWYRNGATFYFEALVQDNEGNVNDETEASISINDQLENQTLIYSKDDNKITGFLTLPNHLANGNHKIKISIADSSGNNGFCFTQVKIDAVSPEVTPKSSTIEKNRLMLAVTEDGSGIDISGTLLAIKFSTREAAGTTTLEGNNLVFTPNNTFIEGNYEIRIRPRDMVGNIGKETVFTKTFNPNSISAKAQNNNSIVTIEKLEYGPNPFHPLKGESSIINYKLSKIADLKYYIYTLDGTQIKASVISKTSAGKIIWDGKDGFGKAVDSGVYVLILSAFDNLGKSEIKTGKIIALQ